jgi:hypothetical protein
MAPSIQNKYTMSDKIFECGRIASYLNFSNNNLLLQKITVKFYSNLLALQLPVNYCKITLKFLQ